jgi:outer membrane protein assembly factor BamB
MNPVKLILSLFLLCSVYGSAQIQSAWRGPERDGIYQDKGLLTQWPEDGPEIIWHFDNLGEGYSSASFYNDKIYLSGSEDSIGFIYVLDMDGSLLWKKPYGTAYTGSYPNTRTTPLVTDGKIYMYTGYGVLICMNADTGEILWSLDTQKELDGRKITWGVTENLLIDGDKLFCSPGGEKYNVIAVNKNTGKLIWSSPGLGDLSAYCSPIIIPRKGRKVLVNMMASHIQGHDVETGEMLWSYEQPNQWSVHPNTPLYADNAIACESGYGKGTVKLNLNEDGSQVSKAWFNETLDNRIGACVKIGDYLYGSGDKNRGWHCVDWNTGELKYSDKSLANGVIIAADKMLFCYTDRGELALVSANPTKFDILSQTKVTLGTKQHWAHPVIRDGKLYLRHGKSLIVYKIK